ncbi:lipoate--protein ligase family protein [Salimicrobium halophilum]|uniref:Lipoate-protein ligase A n=1 Tax=Salimicrobium halophilum TaxID=86666 RepID=A0A1G8TKH8_9BACI|nr:biotin/lipoate A/B protein ligase family protein [Salimicrobium halophilum]SDJ41415.1 lipoate-protein ligase A [Salimicrobium halophilum]
MKKEVNSLDTWSFLYTPDLTPAMNMALDESLMKWHREKKIAPVLRFYTWSPAGLSVGHFQKTDGRISKEGVSEHQVDIVRRLTGGRAVLHDDELTYSVIIAEDHPMIPNTVKEAYLVLSEGLMKGYSRLGIEAEYAIPEEERMNNQSAVCFEEPSWYELTIHGKKAAGSAQVRQKGVLLQHGSIPIRTDEAKLFDMFTYPSERVKERAKNGFKHKAVSIEDAMDEEVTVEYVHDAFLQGFREGLEVAFEPLELTKDDWKEVEALAETKYASDEWNLKR